MYLSVMRIFALFVPILLLSGCTTFNAYSYTTNGNNLEALRSISQNSEKVKIGTFTSYKPGLHSFACRLAGPVTTPHRQPFELYIQQAFEEELRAADFLASDTSIVVDGYLERIAMSSQLGVAGWVIRMRFSSPGKESFVVEIEHRAHSSWSAADACAKVADALNPAVRSLFAKVVQHPTFKSWFSAKAP